MHFAIYDVTDKCTLCGQAEGAEVPLPDVVAVQLWCCNTTLAVLQG